MKGLQDGKLELTESVVAHFDQCLGCMGCVTSCPSGVRYDLLIESTRAKIEAAYPRAPGDRGLRELVFATFPYPGRLKVLAIPLFLYAKSGLQALVRKSGLLKLLPPQLQQLEKLSPSLTMEEIRAKLPPFTPAKGTRRGTVAVIAGCVQRTFFPNVNAATINVLSAEGFDVIVPGDQGCCGALSIHSGRDTEALNFAEKLVRTFGNLDALDAVIINAAGCGSTLKEYGELLHGDDRARAFAAKVKDINEFLGGVTSVAQYRPLPMRVAYHDACHLAHAQGIREQPRRLLRNIPGLELVEIPQGEQ